MRLFLVMLLSILFTPSFSQPATNVWYYIKAKHSGKCLNVQNASSKSGVLIIQWNCTNDENNIWRLEDAGQGSYYIISKKSTKCINVKNDSQLRGASIIQWEVTEDDNSKWLLRAVRGGYYQIISLSSGKCLNVNKHQL